MIFIFTKFIIPNIDCDNAKTNESQPIRNRVNISGVVYTLPTPNWAIVGHSGEYGNKRHLGT